MSLTTPNGATIGAMTELPEGRYLSVVGHMRENMGGLTRLVLMRQRIFTEAGVTIPILTFDGSTRYPLLRESLRDQGLLHRDAEILNLMEWLIADTSSADRPAASYDHETWQAQLADSRIVAEEEPRPDGAPWRTSYLIPGTGAVAHEYRRADGSPALRIPTDHAARAGLRLRPELVNPEAQVVRAFLDRHELHQYWLTRLCPGDERVFVVCDSRFALARLYGLPERFHTMHQLHNPYLVGRRNWNSTVQKTYAPLMNRQNDLDALVSLTHRQRRDIELRYGPANNLEVIPNPVETPETPEPMPERSQRRIVTMARLNNRQKRIDRALQAFALVLEKVPDAVFEIYGRGELEDELRSLAVDLGIDHAVRFMGYDPHARESLWSATAYWVTSSYEGFPLATLEAMSHGCPVVSFDIKYGPSEQIVDGECGFLVPEGDYQAFSDRTVELMLDGDALDRHSRASRKRAEEHSPQRFLSDSADVLNSMAERRPSRTHLEHVAATGLRFHWAPRSRMLQRPATRFDARLSAKIRLRFAHRSGDPIAPENVHLEFLSPQSHRSATLPVTLSGPFTEAAGRAAIEVRASVSHQQVADALAQLGSDVTQVRARLTLAWANSTWTHDLKPKPITVVRDESGAITALARPKEGWNHYRAALRRLTNRLKRR